MPTHPRTHVARRLLPFAFAALSLAPAAARAADWPMFRGPDRNGVSPDAKAPVTWGVDQNVKWKAALPQPGNSSPVVAGDRVFVTCAEDRLGMKRGLFCFARADGKPLWSRTVAYPEKEPTHATNPYCAASPATDGKVVVAWHGSAGLHCYDVDGKPLWSRDLGKIRHIWGYASSPVIHGDVIYVNGGPGARQFLAAVDKNKGDVLWQTDEPGGAEDKDATGKWLGAWNSPVVAKVDGQEQVLMAMPGHVNAYDPKSGKVLWTCAGTGPLAYSDVLVSEAEKAGTAMAGYGGAAIGFKLAAGSAGDVTATNRLWQATKGIQQRVGSGVVLGTYVYVPNEPYIGCYELLTGKEVWRQPVPGGCWSSITAVHDGDGYRLYATSKPGVTYVFAADPAGYKQLAANDLKEPTNSTPAVSDGQVFLRTAGHVWCIEGK